MILILSTALLLLCTSNVQGNSAYRPKIPNGDKSPGNCYAWGHQNCGGGGGDPRWGTTVVATASWSQAVCLEDDDTDTFTNGEEVGDACCYGWSSGTVDASRGVASSGGTDGRISNPRNVASTPVYTNLFGTGTDIKKFREAVPESFAITSATRSVSSHTSWSSGAIYFL